MTVLLTGAAGFVGRSVLAALRRRPVQVVGLLHHRDAPVDREVRADLGDPGSLAGCCDGVDVVVHVASKVDPDPAVCDQVNARGSRALVQVARAAGVARIVYVSSCAVYGAAEHRAAREDQCRVAPVTPVSASRAAAERHVLDAGGAVVRPLFVYGPGDERFLPAVIAGTRRLPVWIDGGRAEISVIDVADLGRAIADLAFADPAPTGVYHATDTRPVQVRALVQALHAAIGTPVPRGSMPWFVARRVARWLPALTGAVPASAEHRLFLFARDHSYDASRLWSAVGWRPEAGLLERLPGVVG
ncbi:MAG: NAD-dependent epimerase/dehydratase family protein [Myxococcota bacterium]